MKKCLLIVSTCLLLVSCGPSLSDVKVGMTEAEVKDLMGNANHQQSSSNSFTSGGVEESHSTATWEYDGQGKVEFEDGIVVSVD